MAHSTGIQVRQAVLADIEPLSHLLAEAFQDDPFHNWIFPDASVRMRKHRRFFALSLERRISHERVFTTPDLQGMAAWSTPETTSPGRVASLWLMLRFVQLIGARVPFLWPGFRRLMALQPSQPHWYLSILATAPSHRRKGIGAALLRPALDQCDKRQLMAYLESTSEVNIPFYERYGFVVTDEITLPNGPRLWPMRREPGQA